MELFAGATGCSDSSIARLYLERAGNDVTRAVNHFFDSPPGALEETDAIAARTGDGAGSASSSRLSSKRQRISQEVPRQELLVSQSARTSLEGKAAPSPGIQQNRGASRDVSSKPERSAAGSAGGGVHVSEAKPSAQWEEVALGCQSKEVPFNDDCFPPQPTSLDGRSARVEPTDKIDGGGDTQDERTRCKCGVPAKVVTVSKAGANQGRLFYGCVTRKCNFFQWADDAPHTRQALSLVWRRFSLPRFKLCAAPGGGADGGSGFKPQDIRQGAVGDCWFLAGLAVVSERPDLIARVLGGNGLLADEVGCYEVNLFKDGRWERVLVDSWLPCKDPAALKGKEKGLDYLPAFAKASNNQTWPCIVEKAFAKQHGSYDAISGGHVCEAFEALTGAPTETVMLDNDDTETNWAKLLSFSQAGFPMGCATAWDPSRGLNDVGLVSTHAYSVLEVRELPLGVRGARQPSIRDWAALGSATAAAEKARMRHGEVGAGQPLRLVRVRNPWGKREWTGEWSDKSDRWSDSVREELGWSKKNDGTFWMTWQDFMTRFELVDVCKARRAWTHASVAAQVLPRPEASRSFRVRPPAASGDDSSSTWAYITVVQPTKRGRKDSYWYKALGLLVAQGGSDAASQGGSNGGGTLVAACLGGAKRSISCEVFLESGKAYTCSVVCLTGQKGSLRSHTPPLSSTTETTAAGVSTTAAFCGFLLTVYGARPIQVVAGEKRPAAVGYFPVGPSLHQAVSHLWLEGHQSSSAIADDDGGQRLQAFALCRGAALAVVAAGDSAALFVLINTSSSEIGVALTLTSLEGATVSAASPLSETSNVVRCPPESQRVVLLLARTDPRRGSAPTSRFREQCSEEGVSSPTIGLPLYLLDGVVPVDKISADRTGEVCVDLREAGRCGGTIGMLCDASLTLQSPMRYADHGTFRHAFFYRLLTPPSSAPASASRPPGAKAAAAAQGAGCGKEPSGDCHNHTTTTLSSSAATGCISSRSSTAGQRQRQAAVVDLCSSQDEDEDEDEGRAEGREATVEAKPATKRPLPAPLETGATTINAAAIAPTLQCDSATPQITLAATARSTGGRPCERRCSKDTASITDDADSGFNGKKHLQERGGGRTGLGGGGVFSAQPLMPGAAGVVRRAHDALVLAGARGSVGGTSEGYGGGTVGGGGRGIGSISSVRGA